MIKYTCIDSFCGAGGLGLGLKRAGFDILLSFDIDELCIKTIKKNRKYFGHPTVVADISDMLNGNLLERCNLKRGDLFLLAGGPPCQGFSVQRRGSDTDSRNELVLMYGKLINELYPKYFVMEMCLVLQESVERRFCSNSLKRLNKLVITFILNSWTLRIMVSRRDEKDI